MARVCASDLASPDRIRGLVCSSKGGRFAGVLVAAPLESAPTEITVEHDLAASRLAEARASQSSSGISRASMGESGESSVGGGRSP